jgi:hypothetical protein
LLAAELHQPCVLQQAQVFRYRWAADRQTLCDLAHCRFTFGQQAHDRFALRLGQGGMQGAGRLQESTACLVTIRLR